MTISPMSRDVTSRSPRLRSLRVMWPTASSMDSRDTGRFSSDFNMPPRSLASSNGTRRSSLFTTSGITSSAVSKVVNRSPHCRHSRRRRICAPSAARRESLTLVSGCAQNGQYMARLTTDGQGPQGPRSSWTIYGVAPAQLRHRGTRLVDGRLVAVGVEHVRDPVGDLFELRLFEPARRACGRADADAAGHHGRARIVRHRVLV